MKKQTPALVAQQIAKAPTAAASASTKGMAALKRKPPQTAPAAGKSPSANKTAPAAAKAVAMPAPGRAFPLDAMHAPNAESKRK